MEAKMRHLAPLLVLLCASVARADGIDNFTWQTDSLVGLVAFQLPATEPNTQQYTFPFDFLGGSIEGVLAFISPTFAVLGLGDVISPPPGFVQDPNIEPGLQWPYDYWYTGPIIAESSSPIFSVNGNALTFIPGSYGDLTITATLEPSTAVLTIVGMTLIGLLALLVRARPLH